MRPPHPCNCSNPLREQIDNPSGRLVKEAGDPAAPVGTRTPRTGESSPRPRVSGRTRCESRLPAGGAGGSWSPESGRRPLSNAAGAREGAGYHLGPRLLLGDLKVLSGTWPRLAVPPQASVPLSQPSGPSESPELGLGAGPGKTTRMALQWARPPGGAGSREPRPLEALGARFPGAQPRRAGEVWLGAKKAIILRRPGTGPALVFGFLVCVAYCSELHI